MGWTNINLRTDGIIFECRTKWALEPKTRNIYVHDLYMFDKFLSNKNREKNLEFLLTSVGIEYAGQSLALCRIDVTFSRVNSHVSICARNTDANNRGWSSNSVANVLWWPRFWVLCCIAAKIRAFSRFGTRPNLTAVKEKRKSLKRDYNTSWSVLCNKNWYKKTFIYTWSICSINLMSLTTTTNNISFIKYDNVQFECIYHFVNFYSFVRIMQRPRYDKINFYFSSTI